jgi:beta-lactamase class D
MNRVVQFLITGLVALGVGVMMFGPIGPSVASAPSPVQSVLPTEVAQTIDFAPHFRELGIEGSILIYDLNHSRTFQHNPQRNAQAFLPASTFKILNSLIALETGVIADDLALLTWDGVTRTLPEWNRDLNMKEAIRLSAYWFYQVLARRIGHGRMQKWVSQVGYGNQKIGGPQDIDRFWLRGDLRITPQEQIQFLRRLYQNELPFSGRSLAMVKDLLVTEKTPSYTIRSKTGWVGFDDGVIPQIGWLVGYVEQDKNVYFFATNLEMRDKKDASARMAVTRRCLQDLRLL